MMKTLSYYWNIYHTANWFNVYGNLTLADGSITDSSGSISFDDDNLITQQEQYQQLTGSILGNLTLTSGSITDSSGAISFDNENLTTTGTDFIR